MNRMFLLLIAVMFTMVTNPAGVFAAGTVSIKSFGAMPDGRFVNLYTLKNESGASVSITNYGGIVVALNVPDKNGKLGDVVHGYDDLDGYLKATPYFGALIGRYANRIANGRFTLNGQDYQLATNENGLNHLHGGDVGFDKVLWKATPMLTEDGPALALHYMSPDGEEGYPGNLDVKAVYLWTINNELKLDMTATTDKPTVINLTNHAYFNLRGDGDGDILNHRVMIRSKEILPVDQNLIPTGEMMPVAGTPFDFTDMHVVGERIKADNEQIRLGGGYDHCWVIDKPSGQFGLMARVSEPESGRVLEVWSTEPAMQFYSGNFLDGTNIGKCGTAYQHRTAFCMEPEHYPDSPNHPKFPSTELNPGQTYKHTMMYKFTVGDSP